MDLTFSETGDWGLGWIAAEPRLMRRASHALAHEGGVWLVDPVDGDDLDERLARLGEVRGVIQLLDRHRRDGAALAARHGVPLAEVPFDGVPGTPFAAVPVLRRRRWREVALWWPARRALVVPEALGTVPYFLARGEALGVHPLLRLTPPRALDGYPARHLLVGHGPSLHGDEVPALIGRALARSRRDIPRWLAGLPRAARR
ncbi:MAG: hypothetical protein AB7V42_00365 [Thermoleophilia bacterium]